MRRGVVLSLILVLAQVACAQQWVRIEVRPGNAILTVDDTRMNLREGRAELLVQPGVHHYSVESPYFVSVADTFEVKDTTRRDLLIVMQALYAYIEVSSGKENAAIYIDQKQIGFGKSLSNRVTEGDHRLTVILDTMCLYDGRLTVEKGEKKKVDIAALGIEPFRWDAARWLVPLSALGENGVIDSLAMEEAHSAVEIGKCAANVTSNVEGAVIIIDGKEYGNTPLVVPGLVANRRYLITLRKQGYKEASTIFQEENGEVAEVYIKMKK